MATGVGLGFWPHTVGGPSAQTLRSPMRTRGCPDGRSFMKSIVWRACLSKLVTLFSPAAYQCAVKALIDFVHAAFRHTGVRSTHMVSFGSGLSEVSSCVHSAAPAK